MGVLNFFKKKDDSSNYMNEDKLIDILFKRYNCYNFGSEEYNIILDKLKCVCEMKGFSINDLVFIENGQDSIVFSCNDSIIKICNLFYNTTTLTEYVSNCAFILKPNIEECLFVKDRFFSFMEFPKLNTNKINNSDVVRMSCKLRDNGYLWHDPRPSNLGKDNEGRIFLIDYGQLIYINDLDYVQYQIQLNSYKNKFPDLDNAYSKRLMSDRDFLGRRK